MCGIAGIIQGSSSFYTKDHVKKMTDSLAHRGPDGEGFWQSTGGEVLFGHRRLSIIDPGPAAAQPMCYKDRYAIIYNGEIYNYLELRTTLQSKGYQFRTHSDTEVILAAYDHYEDECVDHFNGMFAFAIWDMEKKELFAARDRFGEKPFFYSLVDGQLFFASELKALWAAGVKRVPNQKMLFNFITIGYADNPAQPAETFYEQVFKLPAASVLFYTPASHELVIEKYWDIDLENQREHIAVSEAVEELNQLFSDSVKKRFRSDVPIGTSLSGGLDSSAVVAFSSDLQEPSNSQKCFTAIFPGFEKNENDFATLVARQFNLQHFTTSMTADNLADDLEKLIYHQEEPFGSASIYAQYKVYELAKQQNIKSMLDGQGADEILAGYPKYYKWYWQELFTKRKLLRSGEINYARRQGSVEKFGVNNVIASLLPEFAAVFLEQRYLLHALQHEFLTKDFVQSQSKEAYYTTPPISGLNGALYFNTITHGLEELLRYADRNSMAHGCEVRLPFLDHRLVEFVFSLPAHLKIQQGWTKWILRKTTEQRLPQEIVWRTGKVGFEPPQAEWMQHKKVQEIMHESRKILVTEKILQAKVLDKPVVPGAAYDAGNFDWRYLTAGLFLSPCS